MSKQMKKPLVPELRFPEFKEGEWEKKPLREICDVLNNLRKPVTSNHREKGAYPYYGASGIVDYINDYIFTERLLLVGEDGAKWGAFESTAFIAEGRYWVNNHAHVLRTKGIPDTLLEAYLTMLDISPFITGAAPPKLTLGNLKNIPIPVPQDKAEQQKIADCFSSIDELITAHSQKYEALKAHKKGLMQQLFPAEGETVPKLRFPEFQDAGEWGDKPLGEVAKYENGKAHEQGISETGNFIVVNSKFISTDGDVKKYTDKVFCAAEKDDILMVLSDLPNGRALAKCFFVDADNIYTVNQRICKLTTNKAVSIMLFYSLNRKPYFLAFDDGVKQTNLKKNDVLNCPILLPNDLEEQQKIADCLSSIDDLITTQTQKIESLKTHKKGLMQQLFPAADEVNG